MLGALFGHVADVLNCGKSFLPIFVYPLLNLQIVLEHLLGLGLTVVHELDQFLAEAIYLLEALALSW